MESDLPFEEDFDDELTDRKGNITVQVMLRYRETQRNSTEKETQKN